MKPRTSAPLPLHVRKALTKLGGDLRDARRRRRIPTALLAERAQISRATLVKVEKGDPSVSLGIYASVMFSLGLIERLESLCDVKADTVGLRLEDEFLPQRIRLKKPRTEAGGG